MAQPRGHSWKYLPRSLVSKIIASTHRELAGRRSPVTDRSAAAVTVTMVMASYNVSNKDDY